MPLPGVSNLWPTDHMQPRMAVNAAQHKIVNLPKILLDFFVITCHNVFNVRPKTSLLPLWSRDAKSLDTPAGKRNSNSVSHSEGREGLISVTGTVFTHVGGRVGSPPCHFLPCLPPFYPYPLILAPEGNLNSLGKW